MTPWFEELGHEVPEVYVSVSFPTSGARSGKVIGQCHYTSKDGKPHLLVHPYLDDPVRVLDVTLHELVHATMPVGTQHGPAFGRLAKALGLTGRMTATVATDELREVLAHMVRRSLGPYPHSALTNAGIKKQTTRQKKIVCVNEDCPAFDPDKKAGRYILRMSTKKFEEWGAVCAACGEAMEMEEA